MVLREGQIPHHTSPRLIGNRSAAYQEKVIGSCSLIVPGHVHGVPLGIVHSDIVPAVGPATACAGDVDAGNAILIAQQLEGGAVTRADGVLADQAAVRRLVQRRGAVDIISNQVAEVVMDGLYRGVLGGVSIAGRIDCTFGLRNGAFKFRCVGRLLWYSGQHKQYTRDRGIKGILTGTDRGFLRV